MYAVSTTSQDELITRTLSAARINVVNACELAQTESMWNNCQTDFNEAVLELGTMFEHGSVLLTHLAYGLRTSYVLPVTRELQETIDRLQTVLETIKSEDTRP